MSYVYCFNFERMLCKGFTLTSVGLYHFNGDVEITGEGFGWGGRGEGALKPLTRHKGGTRASPGD